MQLEMFSEVSLKEDIGEYNLSKGTPAIIVDYCPRPPGQEDGYVLEVLNEEGKAFTVIAVAASKIEPKFVSIIDESRKSQKEEGRIFLEDIHLPLET